MQSGKDVSCHQAAGIHALCGGMGCPRASRSVLYGRRRVLRIVHDHRGQAHDRTIPGGSRIFRAAVRFAAGLELQQRGARGVPDVEALPRTAQVAFAEPPDIPPHLIGGIKPLGCQQTIRQAQCHRGIVGPLSRLQPEDSAAHNVLQRGKAPRCLEFHGGP
ncbi:hypothetical protein D3C76_172490 [compost metagenome]